MKYTNDELNAIQSVRSRIDNAVIAEMKAILNNLPEGEDERVKTVVWSAIYDYADRNVNGTYVLDEICLLDPRKGIK